MHKSCFCKIFVISVAFALCPSVSTAKRYDPKGFFVLDYTLYHEGEVICHVLGSAAPRALQKIFRKATQIHTGINTSLRLDNCEITLTSAKDVQAHFSLESSLRDRRLKAPHPVLACILPGPDEVTNDEDLTEDMLTEKELDRLFSQGIN